MPIENENEDEIQNGPESSTETGSTPSQDEETTDETSGEFNPSAFESEYGLPTGSLAAFADEESALEYIRDFTDKTLIAGLGVNTETPAQSGGKSKADKGDDQKPASSGNAEIDALRAELVEVKGVLQRQEQERRAQLESQLTERFDAEVDSWASPKYGTRKSRNYHQTKEYEKLQDLIKTHCRGLIAENQPLSTIETLARRVRAFHGDKATPKKAAQNQAVGTPGGKSQGATKGDAPRNIHELVIGSKK